MPSLSDNRIRILDRYRIYLLVLAVFVVMSVFAPNFFNLFNLTSIMRGSSLNIMVATGFTIVMICGELDLSIGSVVSLGAILTIGLKPQLGLGPALVVGVGAGAAAGLINGLLVAKARINSFIVTLGTMYILQGVIHEYSGGASKSLIGVGDFAVSDFLEDPVMPLLAPRVIIAVVFVAGIELFMRNSRQGRNFYMVGANRESAWVAGVSPDRYLVAAFMISGTMAALGGSLFALSISSATTDLGASSLMDVIAATIIGGTAMAGGKGGVLRSAVAVLMFTILFNGLDCFGVRNEVKIFVSGLLLAAVVLTEAMAAIHHSHIKGRRPELMAERSHG